MGDFSTDLSDAIVGGSFGSSPATRGRERGARARGLPIFTEAQQLAAASGLTAPPNFGGRAPELETRQVRAMVLPAQPIQNDFTGFPSRAVELEAPYPVIVQAQANPLANSNPPSCFNFIYAVPQLRAPVVTTSTTGIFGGQFACVRSTNGGTLYLPAGKWFLYYPDTNVCAVGVFDARDPMFAAWMLAQPGAHMNNLHAADFVLDDSVVVSTVALPGNRWRKWCSIQNTTPPDPMSLVSLNVRVGFNAPPNTNRGVQLAPGQSMTLSGDTLVFTNIQIVREYGIAAGGPTLTVSALEWM